MGPPPKVPTGRGARPGLADPTKAGGRCPGCDQSLAGWLQRASKRPPACKAPPGSDRGVKTCGRPRIALFACRDLLGTVKVRTCCSGMRLSAAPSRWPPSRWAALPLAGLHCGHSRAIEEQPQGCRCSRWHAAPLPSHAALRPGPGQPAVPQPGSGGATGAPAAGSKQREGSGCRHWGGHCPASAHRRTPAGRQQKHSKLTGAELVCCVQGSANMTKKRRNGGRNKHGRGACRPKLGDCTWGNVAGSAALHMSCCWGHPPRQAAAAPMHVFLHPAGRCHVLTCCCRRRVVTCGACVQAT